MNFLRGLFGNKGKNEPRSGDKATNPTFERRMKQVFGLEYNEKGSLYRGYCDDQFCHQLSSAEKCLGMVKGMKRKIRTLEPDSFSEMCVAVSGSHTLLIFDTKRRSMALKTSLTAGEAAKLIADIVVINKKQIQTYKGTFLVSLERV
jgi:Rod binding domain-containing protein